MEARLPSPSKLVGELVALAAALALTGAACEAALAGVPNSYSLKREALEAAAPQVEALVLGPSHAYFGVDPAGFGPWTFNLANVSQSLYYDHALLDAYLPRLPKLKLVVLSLSAYQLHNDLPEGVERWRTYFYERAYGLPSPLGIWHPEHFSYTWLYGNQEAPKLLYHYYVQGVHHPRLDAHGAYRDEPRQAPLTLAQARSRVAIQTHDARPGLVPVNLGHVEAMLAALAERHVAAAIVTTPVHATFRAAADPVVRDTTFRLVGRLAAAHGVPYFNHFADTRFGDDAFWDADHLNPRGAARFTRLVAAEYDATGGPVRLAVR